MKAAVFDRYGPPEVIQIRDLPTPTISKTELLLRVHATTVAAGDWRMRRADPPAARLFNGLLRPRRRTILGMELSGVVSEVGAAVTHFKAGDEVLASTEMLFGAHAEYARLPEAGTVALKPGNIGFEQAAAVVFGGLGAIYFLKRAGVAAGQRVLIYGASGAVGTYALQLARVYGAHVTAVCS